MERLIYSLRGLKNENIFLLSVTSAVFFISSFIHIPIGPTQIHLILLALILGISKYEYIYTSYTILLGNIPAMIIEGLITLFSLNYVKKSMPKLLKMDNL